MEPGIVVRLEGLQAKPELNGVVGKLVKFDETRDRWQVRFEGYDDMLLRKASLVPLSLEECEETMTHAAEDDDEILKGCGSLEYKPG